MYDNCTCTRKGGKKKKTGGKGREGKGGRGGEILAALHGILGPTGAAVPGENPFTGYILASTVLFIRREASRRRNNLIFELLM